MIAVLADIHSNFEALKAVLEDLKDVNPTKPRGASLSAGRAVQEIWCLGDIVGYGPEPDKCCQWVRQNTQYSVLGNHDAAVLGKAPLEWFNIYARQAIKMTQKILIKKNKEFLKELPKGKDLGKTLLVHGSPQDPVFEYIFNLAQARKVFLKFEQKICFAGHTHIPAVFEEKRGCVQQIPVQPQQKIVLEKNCRYIINPGSVGQPRDGGKRASYLIFDEKNLSLEFRRVNYPIEKTQEKMKRLNLPQFLIRRLAFGR